MMHWKGVLLSNILVGGLFLSGCSLDTPGVTDSNPALTLNASQNLSLINLSWDPVKVTGFKEYIILQSTSDIPNSPTPEVNGETSVLKRIDDSDITSYSVSNTLFAPRLCYKLYTAVDDRFLYSSTICVDQDITFFNGFNDRAGHEEGLDEVVLFDRVNARLSSIDYINEELTNTVNNINLTFPMIDISTYQGTTNVFAYDQSVPKVIKYKFPELTALTFKNFNGVLFALNAHGPFVYASVEEFPNSFQVLSRNNFTVIDTRTGISGNRNIAVFDGDPTLILEIGETSMMKYSINPDGKILQMDLLTTGVNQLNTQNTTANNNDYFIGGRLGNIVNRNGEILGSLTPGLNTFNFMNRISPDNTKAVSIINDVNKIFLEINDISALPAITKIASYEMPQANFADLIVEDHIIYVIGVTFAAGQAQTFMTKYPI